MPDPYFEGAADYEAGLPELRSPRLLLRPLREADDPALVYLFSDERSLETWFRPPFETSSDAREYRQTLQEGFERRSLFIWGVFVPRNEGEDELVLARTNGPRSEV